MLTGPWRVSPQGVRDPGRGGRSLVVFRLQIICWNLATLAGARCSLVILTAIVRGWGHSRRWR